MNSNKDSSISSRVAGVLFLVSIASCSTVPDWSPREAREMFVTVVYDGMPEPRAVALPSSTEHLLVTELIAEPEHLRQTFTTTGRELHLPGDSSAVRVHCHYRLFRRHGPDGAPLPWRTALELFPGAQSILDRSTAAANGPPE